jgi:predicted RNase H-like HicB family nuclease
MTYALIHEENGSFGISFPDFPGCISGGKTAEEALRRGRSALAFHIAGLAEDGDAMPPLRNLDELRADRRFRADAKSAVVTLVDVDLPGKALRLNISLDEHLIARIDANAKASGETRSGWLATASKMRLGEH